MTPTRKPSPSVRPPEGRTEELEHHVSTVLPELLAVTAFVVSFRHVRHVLHEHGADDPSSWALTFGVEALALVALLERRRRVRLNLRYPDRRPQPTVWPTCVQLIGILLVGACNLETAEDGVWGVVVALLGPVLYMLAFSLVVTRGAAVDEAAAPVPAAGGATPPPRPYPAAPAAVAPHSPPPPAEAPVLRTRPSAAVSDDQARSRARPSVTTGDDQERPSVRPSAAAPDDQERRRARPSAAVSDDQARSRARPSAAADDRVEAPRLRTKPTPPTDLRALTEALTQRQRDLLPVLRPIAHSLAASGRNITRDAMRNELNQRDGISVTNTDLGPVSRVLAAEPLPVARSGAVTA